MTKDILKPFEGEFKPCPLCNGKLVPQGLDDPIHESNECDLAGLSFDASKWNARHIEEPLREMAALAVELKNCLKAMECDRSYIENEYKMGGEEVHPALKAKYERDIAIYNEARELIERAEQTINKHKAE